MQHKYHAAWHSAIDKNPLDAGQAAFATEVGRVLRDRIKGQEESLGGVDIRVREQRRRM